MNETFWHANASRHVTSHIKKSCRMYICVVSYVCESCIWDDFFIREVTHSYVKKSHAFGPTSSRTRSCFNHTWVTHPCVTWLLCITLDSRSYMTRLIFVSHGAKSDQINETCHVWMSHGTREWVIWLRQMSHVTNEWVMYHDLLTMFRFVILVPPRAAQHPRILSHTIESLTCDMTHLYIWVTHVYVTWLIYMWHVSFICSDFAPHNAAPPLTCEGHMAHQHDEACRLTFIYRSLL